MKKIITSMVSVLLIASMLAACETAPVTIDDETETPELTTSVETTAESTVETESSTPTPTSTPTPEKADPAKVLAGKKAYFFGDSICQGTGDTEKLGAWGGRIIKEYGMHPKQSKNAGLSGASVSNCRGSNTVYNQVMQNRLPVDFVILEGGVNDAWDGCPVGKMVDASPEETNIDELDLNTFAGGLEKLLYQVKKTYPKAEIGYIICFKLRSTLGGTLSDMSEYVEMTKKICDKWGVPYLNLYEDKEFNEQFKFNQNINTTDGIHPNSAGYEILYPIIAQFMADLTLD